MPDASSGGQSTDPTETVAGVAQLYLGNILYSLEVTALSLDEQQKPADAAFYRGIGRKLAEARGRERSG
ncbi:MAG TPA: hypothetical protein VFC35_08110 [Gemmatimonadaceae bacterium]|nr:hypothetical protein [Gemmatimonadaceae bacterium]